MKNWLIIQSIIDVSILLFVVWFIINQSARSSRLEKKHRHINEKLKELSEDSKRFSMRIREGKEICDTLLQALDQKTREFEELVLSAEKLSDSLRSEKLGNLTASSREERYKMVEKLAGQGMSRKEISKVTGVLKGEVDLILNLSSK